LGEEGPLKTAEKLLIISWMFLVSIYHSQIIAKIAREKYI